MRLRKNIALVLLGIGFAACGEGSFDNPSPQPAVQRKALEVEHMLCKPGEQKCDFTCSLAGGPSSDDCIIQCDDDGAGWTTIKDCGWAQHGLFSDSCMDAVPQPVCFGSCVK